MFRHIVFSVISFSLINCGGKTEPTDLPTTVDIQVTHQDTGRWYSEEQVKQGNTLFAKHCAACHGTKAEATPDWKTPDAAGNYPPPPLDGSAHAWHHPLSALRQVILKGGALYGGQMPAWEGKLSDADVYAAIASFQHYWSDEVYERWLEIEKQSRED